MCQRIVFPSLPCSRDEFEERLYDHHHTIEASLFEGHIVIVVRGGNNETTKVLEILKFPKFWNKMINL